MVYMCTKFQDSAIPDVSGMAESSNGGDWGQCLIKCTQLPICLLQKLCICFVPSSGYSELFVESCKLHVFGSPMGMTAIGISP